jgi:glycosyltransferase involved in cell wall biosynthesis
MSKNNKKPKIALIGPYPPPYGGISVHIQRLAAHLKAKGIEYVIYDDSGTAKDEKDVVCIANLKRWLPKYFFFAKEDIIHYHSPNWILRIIFGLMGFFGKKTIISIHGESLNDSLKNAGWFRKKIIIFALKHTSCIVALNPKIEELALFIGVKPENIEVIPAFIPPAARDADIAEIPRKVWDFIDSHSPVISANAFRISFHNNQDLYGIDMCIDLCANLKQYYPRIGFVFCLPDIGDYEYFEKMKQRIAEKGIGNNFLFITEQHQLYPIIMKSDVFVRPTNTDGYGISIAEAIYFKIPAVASDVCQRPKGTILFKNRDIYDFTLKVKAVLDNYGREVAKLERVENINYADKIIERYHKLTGD